ncbi:hypothetical protein [Acinetobacter sp. YH12103]|uniref:hypothetical protein n=1 Tax=Acinetobacter sp. YH12103 TaxID=2601092 RepID=UPI0015D1FECD|nr:hypothetical protein [Acinetobacter sp. YH12103]
MPLPNILEFIGTNITQRKFQKAMDKLLNFTDELDKRQAATANGYFKSYTTLADANADIANIPFGVTVKVLSVENGGDYYKATSGAISLTKSPYDPVEQAKVYLDEKLSISTNDPEYVFCISDRDSNVLFAINYLGEITGDFKTAMGNTENLPTALTKVFFKDNLEGELYEIADPQGNVLARVESDGTWVLPAIRTASLDSTEITGGNVNLGGSTEAEITKEKLIY